MKHYDVNYDVKLLLRDGEEKKQQKARGRIVDHVLGRSDRRLARLDEVMVRLEREYWTRRETKPISVGLIRNIADAILNRGCVDVVLDVFWKRAKENDGVDMDVILGRGGEFTNQEMLQAARHWFLYEFLLYIQESFERSMQFALLLCERFVGNTESLLNDLARASKLLEEVSRGGTPLSQAIVAFFVLEAAHEPPAEKMVLKGWIERIVEKAAEGNAAAIEVLKSIVNILTLGQPESQFSVIEFKPAGLLEFLKLKFGGDVLNDPLQPVLILPRGYYKLFQKAEQAWRKEDRRVREQGERVLDWTRSHHEELVSFMEERIRAIRERPRRGLRPGGIEHIEVRVTPLRNAGIRAIVFRPEERTFPNVDVDLIFRKETPHLLRMRLPDGEEQFERAVFEALFNSSHDVPSLTDVLAFVMIDSLYRMVAGERDIRERKRWTRSGDEAAEVRPRSIAVAPRFRRLPEGWHPTPEALERAQEEFGTAWVPPDHTFVRGYGYIRAKFKAGSIVYDSPTEPVAVYGDDDLLETGEWS